MRNNADMAHECPHLGPHFDPDSAAIAASAERLRRLAGGRVPALALLLGTGWQAVADAVESPRDLAYAELPAFAAPAVPGHAGRVRLGRLAGHELLLLSGRVHAYEHGRCDPMAGAIRTLAAAGVTTLLQTNAAGSLDPSMPPGALMLVEDHLNLVQASPLVGLTGPDRFVDMADAYDARLRQAIRAAATGQDLHEGVYAWVLGPQFETPAEIRMLQRLGAHAVGMSTVPETILARHAGLRVAALSMITNMACGLSDERLSHAHTLARAEAARAQALRLVAAIVPAIAG